MALRRGQKVTHPGFGPGLVKSVLDGGRQVRVEFERLPGVPYTLPATQLEPPTKRPPAPTPERAPAAKRKVPRRRPDRRTATESPPPRSSRPPPEAATRQLVEALRMGVVPPTQLDRYTVGRDREIDRLRTLIAGNRGLKVIEGHYGTGKSHLIELAAADARAAGFLTSRVAFDPVEVPPSNPLRIYREVVTNLRAPPDGVAGGLTPLLSRLLLSRAHRQPATASFHRYLSPALFALAEGTPESWELSKSFVEGAGGSSAAEVRRALRLAGWRGPQMLALPDYRTFGQVFLYLVGGIATWARDAGWSGLALFFDEAEALDTLGRTSRELAETVLRYFAAATLPEGELPFDVNRLYRGGQKVHRGLPHLFAADQPLIACFAFTPLPEVSSAVRAAGLDRQQVIELEPLPRSAMIELVRKLIAIYGELHPEAATGPELGAPLLEHVDRALRLGLLDSTRGVARLTVEYLDIARHRPERLDGALEALK